MLRQCNLSCSGWGRRHGETSPWAFRRRTARRRRKARTVRAAHCAAWEGPPVTSNGITGATTASSPVTSSGRATCLVQDGGDVTEKRHLGRFGGGQRAETPKVT